MSSDPSHSVPADPPGSEDSNNIQAGSFSDSDRAHIIQAASSSEVDGSDIIEFDSSSDSDGSSTVRADSPGTYVYGLNDRDYVASLEHCPYPLAYPPYPLSWTFGHPYHIAPFVMEQAGNQPFARDQVSEAGNQAPEPPTHVNVNENPTVSIAPSTAANAPMFSDPRTLVAQNPTVTFQTPTVANTPKPSRAQVRAHIRETLTRLLMAPSIHDVPIRPVTPPLSDSISQLPGLRGVQQSNAGANEDVEMFDATTTIADMKKAEEMIKLLGINDPRYIKDFLADASQRTVIDLASDDMIEVYCGQDATLLKIPKLILIRADHFVEHFRSSSVLLLSADEWTTIRLTAQYLMLDNLDSVSHGYDIASTEVRFQLRDIATAALYPVYIFAHIIKEDDLKTEVLKQLKEVQSLPSQRGTAFSPQDISKILHDTPRNDKLRFFATLDVAKHICSLDCKVAYEDYFKAASSIPDFGAEFLLRVQLAMIFKRNETDRLPPYTKQEWLEEAKKEVFHRSLEFGQKEWPFITRFIPKAQQFRVCVGPEEKEYIVPKSLMLNHFPVVARDQQENASNILNLPEHDPIGFELLIQFVRNEKVDDIPIQAEANYKSDNLVLTDALWPLSKDSRMFACYDAAPYVSMVALAEYLEYDRAAQTMIPLQDAARFAAVRLDKNFVEWIFKITECTPGSRLRAFVAERLAVAMGCRLRRVFIEDHAELIKEDKGLKEAVMDAVELNQDLRVECLHCHYACGIKVVADWVKGE